MTQDNRNYRDALGQFATGVTAVTCFDESGVAIGITVNSFASVSLEPKLVLWSLEKSASSLEAFTNAKYHCIHLLSQQQQSLSNMFASGAEDKFSYVVVDDSELRAPKFEDNTGFFMGEVVQQIDAGDHIILLLQIEDFSAPDDDFEPLLFVGGKYHQLAR